MHLSEAASRSRASAATRSPASSARMSPATIPEAGIEVTCPSRRTLACGRGHLLERRDGLLRVELLVEADDGVEDDDGEDGDGIHHFAQHAGDDTGRDENPDDEALELAEENLQAG